jgi:hypothetical protein
MLSNTPIWHSKMIWSYNFLRNLSMYEMAIDSLSTVNFRRLLVVIYSRQYYRKSHYQIIRNVELILTKSCNSSAVHFIRERWCRAVAEMEFQSVRNSSQISNDCIGDEYFRKVLMLHKYCSWVTKEAPTTPLTPVVAVKRVRHLIHSCPVNKLAKEVRLWK